MIRNLLLTLRSKFWHVTILPQLELVKGRGNYKHLFYRLRSLIISATLYQQNKMVPGFIGHYFLFVLVPQLLWFLLSSNRGLPVFCEACSFLSPEDLHQTSKTSSSSECQEFTESRADDWTAKLCLCAVTPDSSLPDVEEEIAYQQNLSSDGMGGWWDLGWYDRLNINYLLIFHSGDCLTAFLTSLVPAPSRGRILLSLCSSS